MAKGQMLYLILVIVASLIFAGTLMRTMLLTSEAGRSSPQNEHNHDRAMTLERPAH